MLFRQEYTPAPLTEKIGHGHKIFLIGSCFTENMAEKLVAAKFHVFQNPSGILFNPVSVCNTLTDCMAQRAFVADELFGMNEAFHSWDFHGRFSSTTENGAIEAMNGSIRGAHRFLKNADLLIMTLGSAWAYFLTPSAPGYLEDRVAANNHKAPGAWFDRKLLTAKYIEQKLCDTITALKSFNARLKIIFTVSPVRHLREGFVGNNRSKAALIQAVHELADREENVFYFPAFELVIDDLRDYRFFAEDMVHPNYAATNYVWEKFSGFAFSEQTRERVRELNEIALARKHRPFNPRSLAHQKFLSSYHQKCLLLRAQCPEIDLDEELNYFAT